VVKFESSPGFPRGHWQITTVIPMKPLNPWHRLALLKCLFAALPITYLPLSASPCFNIIIAVLNEGALTSNRALVLQARDRVHTLLCIDISSHRLTMWQEFHTCQPCSCWTAAMKHTYIQEDMESMFQQSVQRVKGCRADLSAADSVMSFGAFTSHTAHSICVTARRSMNSTRCRLHLHVALNAALGAPLVALPPPATACIIKHCYRLHR
jgi:hypothetical protein